MSKKTFTIDYIKRLDDNDIHAEINISFIPNKDKTQLKLLSFTVSTGCQSCDYSFVIDEYTLEDILKELIEYYNW